MSETIKYYVFTKDSGDKDLVEIKRYKNDYFKYHDSFDICFGITNLDSKQSRLLAKHLNNAADFLDRTISEQKKKRLKHHKDIRDKRKKRNSK